MSATRHHRGDQIHAWVTLGGHEPRRAGVRRVRVVAIAAGAMALSGLGVGAAYGALSTASREAPATAAAPVARSAVVTAPVLAQVVAQVVAPAQDLTQRVSGLVDESSRIVAEKEERRLAEQRAADEAAKRAEAQAAKAARAAWHGESTSSEEGTEGCGWKDAKN